MIFRALIDGVRLVARSWSLVLVVGGLLVAAALPAGLWMRSAVEKGIGGSRVQVDLRERMDLEWLSEFHAKAGRLGDTLEPETTSRVDRLHNLELLLTGRLFELPVAFVATGLATAFVWSLLLGGVLDRYARGGGPLVLGPFLGACGRYFGRLLRLILLSVPVYWGLYRLGRTVFSGIEAATRDVTSETTVLLYYATAALALMLLALLVTAFFDFAKIASVVSEDGTVLGALSRAGRCLAAHPFRLPALALLLALGTVALVVVRTLLPIGVEESSASGIAAVFAVGQLFVLARVALRLLRIGSQLSFYTAWSKR